MSMPSSNASSPQTPAEAALSRSGRHLDVERIGDVTCARFRTTKLDESTVHELGAELLALVDQDGCRKLVVCLGPEEIVCLYSVLLSKLVTLQKHLLALGGVLRLAAVGPATKAIFEVCRLNNLFEFSPDRATAIAELSHDLRA
jgi:anti-anti-sigma factor